VSDVQVFGPGEPPQQRLSIPSWVGGVALLVAVLAAGAGVIATTLRPVAFTPQPSTSSSSTTSGSALAAEPPAPPPSQPGIEPPKTGDWPAAWPKFATTDRTRQMSGLDGVGFAFRVPESWVCTKTARAADFARYTCGASIGASDRIGGDLTVRACPQPCDNGRRSTMRMAEEAWGLQWTRVGTFLTFADTTVIDGAPRYGLVIVTYWRTAPEKAIDRQLVLRMNAPMELAAEVRKVANSVRDATR